MILCVYVFVYVCVCVFSPLAPEGMLMFIVVPDFAVMMGSHSFFLVIGLCAEQQT